MATEPEVKAFVIDRMDLMLRPRWDPETEPKRYLEMVSAYCRVLGSYSTEVLKQGMDLWESGWIKRSWPMPAELAPFMNQAKADLEPPVPQIPDRSDEPRKRTPAEVAAYREETARMVAALDSKLEFLDRVGTKPPAPAAELKPAFAPMNREAMKAKGLPVPELEEK